MRCSRWLLTTAAILSLVAASCSSDGGNTTTNAADTSSTLPSSESVAAGVGVAAPEDTAIHPAQQPDVPNTVHGPRPSSGAAATEQKHTATTTTGAGSGTTTTTTTTLPPGLPVEKCPDAKTCRRYAVQTSPPPRWPVANGTAEIVYQINPAGCSLSSEDMRRALEDATSSWERAAPTLAFKFAGFTERLPVPDGYNVIGCTGPSVGSPTAKDGSIREADMLLSTGLTYTPCQEADNSCTPLDGSGGLDAASIATHELGHWLWLGDMKDDALDRELTMSPGAHDGSTQGRSRHWRTLALGDVLGVRALYPCSCPLPPIYSP